MIIRPPPQRPVIFALQGSYGQVVDAREAGAHQAVLRELPVLVAVRAKPIAGVIVPLVSEAYGDPVPGKRPHFLDKPVVQLLGPLTREESDNFVSSVNEFRSIPPS